MLKIKSQHLTWVGPKCKSRWSFKNWSIQVTLDTAVCNNNSEVFVFLS